MDWIGIQPLELEQLLYWGIPLAYEIALQEYEPDSWLNTVRLTF
ncbi:hypothetical protein SAMD00079811_81960 (plasmid) [Scytonema sp. HK-05]|nr:hypothetical protein [Scytonema sp. HK-05]BAY50567.1 hypothetical protein SAMD00079811_81960 [Scytonema sp. HK-05]